MRKLLTTIALLAASSAHADFFSGNDLLSRLTDSNTVNRAVGVGYIAGVADTTLNILHCAPANIALKQAVDVTQIALTASPEDRHKAAESLVIRALATAWPCPKQNRGSTL